MLFNEYLKNKYDYNEPIFADEIKFEKYSRPWIYKELKKMILNGEIKHFDTGIYYFPQKMPWGDSTLDARKVVNRRFISDGVDVFGYFAGLSLLNMTALSTQVPNLIEVVTNKETTRVRDVVVGQKRVRVRRSRTNITKENVNALRFLELMNSITPSAMDETDQFMLRKFIRESRVTRDDVSQYLALFPAKAMKNMTESGAVYELT